MKKIINFYREDTAFSLLFTALVAALALMVYLIWTLDTENSYEYLENITVESIEQPTSPATRDRMIIKLLIENRDLQIDILNELKSQKN